MTHHAVSDDQEAHRYRVGIWYGVAAYVVWGLSPLFWNITDAVSSVDLLAHRTVWAVPLLALAITATRRWGLVARSYATWRPRLLSTTAAVLLAVNWGVFLWAVTHDQVVEASLGYFINPLVSVALGVVVLGERLRTVQWTAVAVASAGVAVMAVRVGSLPWVSLTLAMSFGLYGLLKKHPATPAPLVSLFGEVSILAIPALIVIVIGGAGVDAGFGTSVGTTAFLLATGAMTVVPLLLFGGAAKRIPLSLVGVLQYIAPTMQFLLGVTVFGEDLARGEVAGFILVWVALGLYSFDASRNERALPSPVR